MKNDPSDHKQNRFIGAFGILGFFIFIGAAIFNIYDLITTPGSVTRRIHGENFSFRIFFSVALVMVAFLVLRVFFDKPEDKADAALRNIGQRGIDAISSAGLLASGVDSQKREMSGNIPGRQIGKMPASVRMVAYGLWSAVVTVVGIFILSVIEVFSGLTSIIWFGAVEKVAFALFGLMISFFTLKKMARSAWKAGIVGSVLATAIYLFLTPSNLAGFQWVSVLLFIGAAQIAGGILRSKVSLQNV